MSNPAAQERIAHPLLVKAQEEGEFAVSVLQDLANRKGGWFDCECGSCTIHGDDFHAWEAFERAATDASHYACAYMAQQDFEALAAIGTDRSRSGHHYGQPLTVKVEDGRLVIAIGVQTLAHAVTYADWANPWRDDPSADAGGDYRRDFIILDAEQFAKDVAHAMLAEREDGSTPLSDFIDKSSLAAIGDGSIATEDAPKGGISHGKTDAREAWANR